MVTGLARSALAAVLVGNGIAYVVGSLPFRYAIGIKGRLLGGGVAVAKIPVMGKNIALRGSVERYRFVRAIILKYGKIGFYVIIEQYLDWKRYGCKSRWIPSG
jgi:hypothetical protein